MNRHWCHLQTVAQAEVEAILSSLPVALRESARSLPVSYEARPGRQLIDEGIDADVLGLFLGADFAEPNGSPLPPQIVLFLENIWDFAEGDDEIFLEEVHTTYLHELGHYLGLGEGDLEERGLE
jgi:predicted Zn-dependent protease with MMP-like domain